MECWSRRMSEKLHFPQDGMLAGLLLYFTMHDGYITMLCKPRSNSYIHVFIG